MARKKITTSLLISTSFLALSSSSWAMMEGENKEEGSTSSSTSRVLSEAEQAANAQKAQLEGRIKADSVFFYSHLKTLASELQKFPKPSIFISYSWHWDWDSENHRPYEGEAYEAKNKQHAAQVEALANDLVQAGIPVDKVLLDIWWNRPMGGKDIFSYADKILEANLVIVVGSPGLQKKYWEREGVISEEINQLRLRIKEKGTEGIAPIWFEGLWEQSFPPNLRVLAGRPLGGDYYSNFFDLMGDIYQTHLVDPRQNPVRTLQQEFTVMRGDIPPEMLGDYGQRVLAS